VNERIRELAEQAGYKPLPGFDFANSLEETYLKKFAELIVKECADLTRWQEYDMSSEQRIRLEIYQDIKQHFGVES
jgi:hypothetical protein